MTRTKSALALLLACGALLPARAATWYVATNGSDAATGTTWAEAKQTIQAAVDLAAAGDTVLVSNGVYATGVTVTPGFESSNRVVITKNIHVRSVNGPGVTSIRGLNAGGSSNATLNVRCVFITNGLLAGFTLTNGAAPRLASTDVDSCGGGAWARGGLLTNCVIAGNASRLKGGGVYEGRLINCTISGNTATSTLSASGSGGGSYGSTLINCVVSSNKAVFGGGCYYGILSNCTVRGNAAAQDGGGVSRVNPMVNCVLWGNSAGRDGGGVNGITNDEMDNCTVYGNTAGQRGGGTFGLTVRNCIVYFNASGMFGPNVNGSFVDYTCTTPLPSMGFGNFTNDPLFMDVAANNVRLRPGSPCIDAGNNAFSHGNKDLDGLTRIRGTNVDLGAYEGARVIVSVAALPAQGGTVSGGGPLVVGLTAALAATPNAAWRFTSWNDGDTDAARFITVPATNITYTANFTQVLGAVSVQADPAGGGTVSGGGLFPEGSTQQVSAAASYGWAFTQWSDGSTENPRAVIVSLAGTNLTASFAQRTTELVAAASPTNGGHVSGGGTYFVGSTQEVAALANFGWRFDRWDDGSAANPRAIEVPLPGTNVTALFTQVFAVVSVDARPADGGAVLGGGTYPAGADIVISAAAHPGWHFTTWDDGDTNAIRAIAVPETNLQFSAGFTQQLSTVTLIADPVNGGAAEGGGVFQVGSNLLVQATPDAFWFFGGWSDGETNPVRTVVVPATDLTFTAFFSQRWATVSVAARPAHGGSAVGGGSYPAGAQAGISAAASRGWRFLSWSDGHTQAIRTVGVPLTGATLVATFRARTRLDFDGDDRADIAVFHPAQATWYVRRSAGGTGAPAALGTPASVAVAGDYDGDGLDDLAAYDAPSGNWIIGRSASATVTTNNWGWQAAAAVPADYDGDGTLDLAVFHPATGTWYIRQSGSGTLLGGAPISFGWSAAMPVPADYDGDGKADLAVYYPAVGAWYVRQSTTATLMGGGPINFGWSAAAPVPLDYDGDGLADLAVLHQPAGNWYIRRSTDGQLLGGSALNWGWSAAVPVMPQFQINRRYFPAP